MSTEAVRQADRGAECSSAAVVRIPPGVRRTCATCVPRLVASQRSDYMRKTSLTALMLGFILLSVFTAGASAQSSGSAVDQYQENPGSPTGDGGDTGGGGAGGSSSGGSSGGGGSSVPQATQQQLNQQGSEGAAAADLAEQTAPSGAGGNG